MSKPEERIVEVVARHLKYIRVEGWEDVEYRLYRVEENADVFILALEYWDDARENHAGKFWPLTPTQVDEVRIYLFDQEIEPMEMDDEDAESEETESVEEGEVAPPTEAPDGSLTELSPQASAREFTEEEKAIYREGYREGYTDGMKDGMKHNRPLDGD